MLPVAARTQRSSGSPPGASARHPVIAPILVLGLSRATSATDPTGGAGAGRPGCRTGSGPGDAGGYGRGRLGAYSPRQTGGRFSANAAAPSIASADPDT